MLDKSTMLGLKLLASCEFLVIYQLVNIIIIKYNYITHETDFLLYYEKRLENLRYFHVINNIQQEVF